MKSPIRRSAIRQTGRHFNSRSLLLLLAAAFIAPLGMARSESVSGHKGDVFSRLVRIVAESGENEQLDFSWIAISELTAAYERVFLNSGSETPKDKKARAKLISWRNGTRRYIAELHGLLERLPGSVELQIEAGKAGPPIIYLDGSPVVISGPEIGSAKLMEKRIIDTYCAMYDCSALANPTEQQPEAAMSPAGGTWTLKNFGRATYTTPDGLIFIFSGVSGRSTKQKNCEAVTAEMRSLVSGLRAAVDAGHMIDWDSLEIQPLADGRGHIVRLNDAGEYLRMTLPLLVQIGPLTPALINWIKLRAIGEASGEVEIFADRLLRKIGAAEIE